jgi:hypothetical protein
LEVEGGSDKGVPPVGEREREGRVEWAGRGGWAGVIKEKKKIRRGERWAGERERNGSTGGLVWAAEKG